MAISLIMEGKHIVLLIIVFVAKGYVEFYDYNFGCESILMSDEDFGSETFNVFTSSSPAREGAISGFADTEVLNRIFYTENGDAMACSANNSLRSEIQTINKLNKRFLVLIDDFGHSIEYSHMDKCLMNRSSLRCVNISSNDNFTCSQSHPYYEKYTGLEEFWEEKTILGLLNGLISMKDMAESITSLDGRYCILKEIYTNASDDDSYLLAMENVAFEAWKSWVNATNSLTVLIDSISNLTNTLDSGRFNACHNYVKGILSDIRTAAVDSAADNNATQMDSILESYIASRGPVLMECIDNGTEDLRSELMTFEVSNATEDEFLTLQRDLLFLEAAISEVFLVSEVVFWSHMAFLSFELVETMNNLSFYEEGLATLRLEVERAVSVRMDRNSSTPMLMVAEELATMGSPLPDNSSEKYLLECIGTSFNCTSDAFSNHLSLDKCIELSFCMNMFFSERSVVVWLTADNSTSTTDIDFSKSISSIGMPALPFSGGVGRGSNTLNASLELELAPDIAYLVNGSDGSRYVRIFPEFSEPPPTQYLHYDPRVYYAREGLEQLEEHCIVVEGQDCPAYHFEYKKDEILNVVKCCAFPPGTVLIYGGEFEHCKNEMEVHSDWGYSSCSDPTYCASGYYRSGLTCQQVNSSEYSPFMNDTVQTCNTGLRHVLPFYNESHILERSFSDECRTQLLQQTVLPLDASLLTLGNENSTTLTFRFIPVLKEFRMDQTLFFSDSSYELPSYKMALYARKGLWSVFLNLEYGERDVQVTPCLHISDFGSDICATKTIFPQSVFFLRYWQDPTLEDVIELSLVIETLNPQSAEDFGVSDVILSWRLGPLHIGSYLCNNFKDNDEDIVFGGINDTAIPFDAEFLDGYIRDFVIRDGEVFGVELAEPETGSGIFSEAFGALTALASASCPPGFFSVWKLEENSSRIKIIFHSSSLEQFRLDGIKLLMRNNSAATAIGCTTIFGDNDDGHCSQLVMDGMQHSANFSIFNDFGSNYVILEYEIPSDGDFLPIKDFQFIFPSFSDVPEYIEIYRLSNDGSEEIMVPMSAISAFQMDGLVVVLFSDRDSALISNDTLSCASCNQLPLESRLLSVSSTLPSTKFVDCHCIYDTFPLSQCGPNYRCPAAIPAPTFANPSVEIIQIEGNVTVEFDCGILEICDIKYTLDGKQPCANSTVAANGTIPIKYPESFGITEVYAAICGTLNGVSICGASISKVVDIFGTFSESIDVFPPNGTLLTENSSSTSEADLPSAHLIQGDSNSSFFFFVSVERRNISELVSGDESWHKINISDGNIPIRAPKSKEQNCSTCRLFVYVLQLNSHFNPSIEIAEFFYSYVADEIPSETSDSRFESQSSAVGSTPRTYIDFFKLIHAKYTIPIALILANTAVFIPVASLLILLIIIRDYRAKKSLTKMKLSASSLSDISVSSTSGGSISIPLSSSGQSKSSPSFLHSSDTSSFLESTSTEGEVMELFSSPPRPVVVKLPNNNIRRDLMI